MPFEGFARQPFGKYVGCLVCSGDFLDSNMSQLVMIPYKVTVELNVLVVTGDYGIFNHLDACDCLPSSQWPRADLARAREGDS